MMTMWLVLRGLRISVIACLMPLSGEVVCMALFGVEVIDAVRFSMRGEWLIR